MGKVLGYTRLTVPGNPSLQNRPAVVKVGGKLLDDTIEEVEKSIGEIEESIGEIEESIVPREIVAEEYDEETLYIPNDLVMHDGELFYCTEEQQEPGEFDPEYWVKTKVTIILADLLDRVKYLENRVTTLEEAQQPSSGGGDSGGGGPKI